MNKYKMRLPAVLTLSEVVESKVTEEKPRKKFSVLSWCNAHWRHILSEFIATLLLILLGCMGTIPISGSESLLSSSIGFGIAVMFNIQIFGHISGAYMNPAVTIATVIWGKTSVPLAIAYIIVQCLGAIAGYGILEAVTSMDVSKNAVCVTVPYTGQTPLQSLGIEIAITVALIFINCAIWDPVNKEKQDSVPIKFGLTIIGISVMAGAMTGSSMNPARSLGPAIWTNIWTDHWIYWVGPSLAGISGALLYKFVFLETPKDE